MAVIDGDSLDVLHDGASERIRLEGIDAPEFGQPFSRRAKEALADLVFGRDVVVQGRTVDRYGRLIARVFSGDVDTSLAMVESGWAWHFKKYSSEIALAAAERHAKQSMLGLWVDPAPTPPWEYRASAALKPVPLGLFEEKDSTTIPGPFHGNTRSLVYHSPECRNYSCLNCTAIFETAVQAEDAGFRPAGDCLRAPDEKVGSSQKMALDAAPYHANQRSGVFHKRGCRNYSCLNCRIPFSAREEALSAGYRPAGCCKP